MKEFPLLKQQFLFYNCFIISSDEAKSSYDKVIIKYKELNGINLFYKADYLYLKYTNDNIFTIKNGNEMPIKQNKFCFLKQHILYYNFLEMCLQNKKDKKPIDSTQINEILYRTLLKILYLLESDDSPKINYGISKIFNCTCIYIRL